MIFFKYYPKTTYNIHGKQIFILKIRTKIGLHFGLH